MKAAILSCLGLGDALITLVLSNNLKRNGWETLTFHPFFYQLQEWFPDLPLQPRLGFEEMCAVCTRVDAVFLFFEKTPWIQEILAYCQKNHPHKLKVLNPIATTRTDYPYWETGRFDGSKPFVENLFIFCRDILELPKPTRSNGLCIPSRCQLRRFEKRIVIHPASARPGKNWPILKYLELMEKLRRKGYEPVFILKAEEQEALKVKAPHFASLDALSSFIVESGFMIGNDSGIGHLASCLGLSTVIVCPRIRVAHFWRPSWSSGAVVVPSPWIPNIKGLRWRDKHWKKWISVRNVLEAFENTLLS